VDHLKEVAGFFSLKENFKSSERFLNDINILLSKSSLMIEEEFKNLMITHRLNLHFAPILNHYLVGSLYIATGSVPVFAVPLLSPKGICIIFHFAAVYFLSAHLLSLISYWVGLQS
jgi:hypothetical protein